MTVAFRNIDVDVATSLDTWPAEAIEILIDRGELRTGDDSPPLWRQTPGDHCPGRSSGQSGSTLTTASIASSERVLHEQRSRSTLAGRRRYADRRHICGANLRLRKCSNRSDHRLLARLEDVLARFTARPVPRC